MSAMSNPTTGFLARKNRKFLIGGGIVIVLLIAFFALRGLSFAGFLDGEIEKVSMGDLVIPITAPGTIDANELVEMKAKASGEVSIIHVVEGQMVKEGDLLIELDPVDERRNLERAETNLARAESSLNQARIQLTENEQTLPINTRRASASLDDARARMSVAEVDWEKTDALYKKVPPVASKQEWTLRKCGFEQAQAAVVSAEGEYQRAQVQEKTVLDNSKQNLKLAEAAFADAKKQLEEAQLRLRETRVLAPKSGMVYAVRTRKGELVQSGKTSLTGGTPLLYIADISNLVVIAQVDEADIGAVRRLSPERAQPGHTRRLTDDERATLIGNPIGETTTTTSAPADPALEAVVGRPVKVTVEAYRGEVYEGVIERILPQPQKVNTVLTFDVRIVLRGNDIQKLLGMQADVEFTADKVENVMRVKNEAVFSEGREAFVYIPQKQAGSNRLDEKKVPVKIGVTDGIWTEIRSGWPAGVTDYFIKRPIKTQREKEESEKSK